MANQKPEEHRTLQPGVHENVARDHRYVVQVAALLLRACQAFDVIYEKTIKRTSLVAGFWQSK